MEPYEIEMHRRNEKWQDIGCRVFDVVAQFLASREITPQVEQQALDIALRQFAGQLPDGMIIKFAARQIGVDEERRRIAKAAPKPPRKDRFGRPIRENKSVLPLSAPQTS